ncbi:unnamed protein product [Clonostachys byssicola]|uniref:Uncharacterized protein n=1 Tax=Clonostachys byssicola TaxID=160290 RepID=A0A9N9UA43_9HYPO|nr:unnamed protein product [Clonostachys byssicola]
MNESAQGSNPGDLDDLNRAVNVHDLVAQYRVLAREYTQQVAMKDELFGREKELHRLLIAVDEMLQQVLMDRENLQVSYRAMELQGTSVSEDEKRSKQAIINTQQSEVEETQEDLKVELDDSKAVDATINEKIAEIRDRLEEIDKIIQEAHPEVADLQIP